MKNQTSLKVPLVDSAENLNIRDVDGNKEDAAVIAVGTTKSQMAYIKGILSVILTLTTEDYDMTIYVPAVVDVDNTMMPQVTFYDKKLKAAVASGDIVAGTFKLARYRANSRTEILGATAWTVTTGKIKDSRQAASVSWATDDLAVWEPQGDTTIEVNGVVVTPMIPELMIPIGDISTLETKLSEIQADLGDFSGIANFTSLLDQLGIPDVAGKDLYTLLVTDRLDSATFGLSALQVLIAALQTDLDNGTDGLGALKALIDLIQTDTTAIIADITSAVDEPPTAKSLQDTLHKDGSYTFDNETDSLEAISDSVSTGSLEIEADIGSTATNIIDAATLTQATANWFRNAMVVSIDGDNKGQARRIVASNTGTDSIDVYPAFLAAPTDGDKFLIVSSWQPNVLDQQPDVAVNRTVGTDSVDVFNLNIAGLTYMVNNLTLKFADPAAETITVTLTELINDAPVAVDTFTVTTENFTNYFSLYDMFSRQQLAGDDIQVSMVASADNAYSVTGQYQYSETYTG